VIGVVVEAVTYNWIRPSSPTFGHSILYYYIFPVLILLTTARIFGVLTLKHGDMRFLAAVSACVGTPLVVNLVWLVF
jgi:hypothetical protein